MPGFIYMFFAVSLEILRNEYTVSFFTYQALFHGISWNHYWTHELAYFKQNVFLFCVMLCFCDLSKHLMSLIFHENAAFNHVIVYSLYSILCFIFFWCGLLYNLVILLTIVLNFFPVMVWSFNCEKTNWFYDELTCMYTGFLNLFLSYKCWSWYSKMPSDNCYMHWFCIFLKLSFLRTSIHAPVCMVLWVLSLRKN